MRFSVVGVYHRSGDFEGRHFDNYFVQCTFERNSDQNLQGLLVDQVKIPAIVYRNDIVPGCVIDVAYDKYGKVQGYTVL